MAITDEIRIGNEMREIGAKPQNVSYSNAALPGVANVKAALDALVEGGSSGGGMSLSTAGSWYKNPAIPFWKDKYNVLFIGNSFTIYSALGGLTTMLDETGIEDGVLSFKVAHHSAKSLTSWLEDSIRGNVAINQLHRFEYNTTTHKWGSSYDTPGGSLSTLISQTTDPWDLILFQVYPPTGGSSEAANSYGSFKQTLRGIVKECRKLCPNPDVAFAFHMIWSASQERSSIESTWQSICAATREMMADSGIDIIVPTGTAFMRAANTNAFRGENCHFLKSDDVGHPAPGVGRYIAACCIWEAVFAPYFGKSMYGMTSLPPFSPLTGNNVYQDSQIEVTASNIQLCQTIARAAMTNMFSIDG